MKESELIVSVGLEACGRATLSQISEHAPCTQEIASRWLGQD